eukprot:Unigene2605_Nuclearia_a/m.8049 Unigene2605_Nuclearia_a/g.8049  ORF Unigene2605_Nuclearia_a/g.8049 Unigene2605_Nuclearia_a/m.8049 type:complete len:116 (-) Unigene2605_Nuclearia_a:20-367(-)
MLRQMSTHLTSAVEELAHVKNELANQQAQAPTPKTNLQQVREATEQRMASREEVSRLQSRNHKIQDAHEQLQRDMRSLADELQQIRADRDDLRKQLSEGAPRAYMYTLLKYHGIT